MKALLSIAAGDPDTLRFEEIPAPRPAAGQLLIDVKAVGVNFYDLLIIQDRYQFQPPRPFVPGGEVVGVVREVGKSVSGFAVGDHVVGFCVWGAMAEQVAVDAALFLILPAHMPFVSAAALLVTYGTADLALELLGKVQPGETLLVLGASGGVGLAALELGRARGARVIAGVSSQEKLALALSRGAHVGVIYPRGPLDKSAQKALVTAFRDAGGTAPNVVCDCIGGDYAEPALRSMAWGGRYLIVGFAAGVPQLPLTLPLVLGCHLIGVFWGEWLKQEPQAYRASAQRLIHLLEEGKLNPHVSLTVPLPQAAMGIAALGDRSSVGKVVVTV